MKKFNNKWYDSNNNSWDCSVYTEEQAERWSKTLVNCNNCHICNNCHNCTDCYNCNNCHNCDNCDNCNNWNKTPQSIVSNYIGSRDSQTTIYFGEDKTEVVCGCFKGTLEEFEVKVNNEYSEESKHGIEYRNFIKKAKVYMESK